MERYNRYDSNSGGGKLATINRCHAQAAPRKPREEVEQEALLPPQTFHNSIQAPLVYPSRTSPDYLGTMMNQRELPNPADAHDYLEVDLISRLRNLQSEIDILRNSVQTSDGSSKSKETCIYEKIDHKPRKVVRPSLGHSPVAQDAHTRGLYRLSRVCNSNATGYSRVTWGFLLAVCLGITVFHVTDRVLLFFSAPSHYYSDTRPVDSLSFPAVTICNLNQFRLTEVSRLGIYDDLYEALHNRPASTSSTLHSNYTSTLNMVYEDFARRSSHKKADLIHRCLWQNRQCGVDNFTAIFTELGLCYRFQAHKNQAVIMKSGQQSGLFLALNIEQYEYILGPMSAVGAAVALSEPQEPPAHFVHVPAGKYTTLEVTMNEIVTSAAVRCKDENGEQRCQQSCRDMQIALKCHCSFPPNWHDKSSYRSCKVHDYLSCVRKIKDKSTDDCHCDKTQCDRVDYRVSSSYASIPKYGAESEVRTLRYQNDIQEKFRAALDTYHKVDRVIAEYDEATLRTLSEGFMNSAKVSRDFVAYLKRYVGNFKDVLGKMRSAFERYNTTIKVHYGFLKSGSHMSFSNFIHSSKELLGKIQGLEGELQKTWNADQAEKFWKDVTWRINQLITTEDTKNYSSSPFLNQVKEGIDNFRDKLVNSFGGPFKEFQKHRGHYNDVTNKMLRHIEMLETKLTSDYNTLKAARKESSNKLEKMRLGFERVFRDAKYMLSNEMRKLLEEEAVLRSSYNRNRTKVLKDMNEVESLSQLFDKQFLIFGDNISRVIAIGNESTEMLTKLGKKLSTVADDYTRGKFTKIELGDVITKSDIRSTLQTLERTSRGPKEIIRSMPLDGTSLSDTIRTVVTRLVEFSLLENNQILESSKLLALSELTSRSDGVISAIDHMTQTMTSYLTEIQAYTSGRKIDESFYRNNFLYLDVYFKEMKKTTSRHDKIYGLLDLFCDIGGVMALYLGISLLTIVDAVELFVRATCRSAST